MEAVDKLVALRAWCQAAPPGTVVDPKQLVPQLLAIEESIGVVPSARLVPGDEPPEDAAHWFWTCDPDRRISPRQFAEALGKSRSWVYQYTSERTRKAKGLPPLPYRKLGGQVVFRVGDMRDWYRNNEEILRRP